MNIFKLCGCVHVHKFVFANHKILWLTKMYIVFVFYLEPDDVPICEGEDKVFSCVLNTADNNINSDDVQWYRLVKDTGITEMVDQQDSNIRFITSTINNTLTSQLTITSAITSHTGYYWVGTPSFNVCNASLTVTTSTCIQLLIPHTRLSRITGLEWWNELDLF